MFKLNENIIHDSFGEGEIINITGSENERKLVVHFIDYGQKILIEKLAKEKITYTDKIIDFPKVKVEAKPKNNNSSNSIHPQWIEAYERLKYYLENNTNPNYKCPNTGKRYSFYFWLCKQKRLFHNGDLNQGKIDMLNQIVDLNESKRARRVYTEAVHSKLSSLLSFIEAGNPLYKHQDNQVYYQRLRKLDSQKHKIKNIMLKIKSTISTKGISTKGTAGSQKEKWENNYNALWAYLKEHNCMVPQHIEGDYKKGKRHKLYRWYYKQKGRYNKKILASDYVEKFSMLEELVRNTDNAKRYVLVDINERLDKLKDYISNGELPPCRKKDGSRNKLRVFLDNQINHFRSGKMPLERIEQFNGIGLDLDNITHNYKKRNQIDEDELVEVLNDIYLHLKEGKSMSTHDDNSHFYRRSSDKKREGQSDRVKEIIEKIIVESNKQKIEKPIIILKRILKHVELGEPLNSHPSSSIYYTRERKYDTQAIEVKKLVAKIKNKLNQNMMDKPKQILTGILNHVKIGEPIYAHPHSAVYYGRQKKKQIQIPEIQELLEEINVFIEANSQIKNPYYILSDILEFVKSGGTVNEHPKSNYYYSRVESELFLEEDISVLIKEINYYMDLNQFSDAE